MTAAPEAAAPADDLTELAALLNEVRKVWRQADEDKRGRMRRGILVVLRGCRGEENPFKRASVPLAITDDGWFTERAGEFEVMTRDQLLHEARKWAWKAQMATVSEAQHKAGTRAITHDIERRLAKAKYLARSGGKMIKADDLKIILDDCSVCGRAGELVRNGYVHCRACDNELAALKAGARDAAEPGALFAPGGERGQ